MQAMNAAPYQIAFVSFDDNNDIIIRHDFCIIPPLYCLGNVKTTSQNSNSGFSQNRRVSRVSQFRIFIRLFSFSTRRVKITPCGEDRR